jgi:alpha-beta hydrolase superfamily lysophospholipase
MPDPIRFGSRATVVTLTQKLDDATVGNRDGIVGNEKNPAGSPAGASVFDTNPMLFSLRAFFEAGASKKDEESRLRGFLDAAEKSWGRPVADIPRPAHVDVEDWSAHLVDKAITLVRFGREPGSVVDGIVHAKGSVDGHAIEARDVFVQTWKPIGPPSGKTIVLSPGFLESGRNYAEQAQLLNRAGHEVVVLDHQWAGLSSGKKGGIDRGFGIARDVASVVADVATRKDARDIVVVGTSMGAGAGALGAILMNDAGKVALDGPPMPVGISAVLQGPFFAKTETLPNKLLAATGKVPGVNQIPLPALGLPILSGDQATLRKIAAHATTEHLSGRPQAFHASDEDIATMKKLLEAGTKPRGKIDVIHARGDTLANYDASVEFVKLLGDRGHLTTIESTSHVFEENPREQGLVLEGLKRLGV